MGKGMQSLLMGKLINRTNALHVNPRNHFTHRWSNMMWKFSFSFKLTFSLRVRMLSREVVGQRRMRDKHKLLQKTSSRMLIASAERSEKVLLFWIPTLNPQRLNNHESAIQGSGGH